MRPPPPQMAMELSKRRVQPRRGDFGEGDVEDRSLSQDPYVAFAVDCGLCDRVALPNPLRRRDEGPTASSADLGLLKQIPTDGAWPAVVDQDVPRRALDAGIKLSGESRSACSPQRALPQGTCNGSRYRPSGRSQTTRVTIATYGEELVRLVLHP